MRWWKRELDKARELADELVPTAEEVKDPAMRLSSHFTRGSTLCYLGELVSANEHLEEAFDVFDLRQPLPAELELHMVSAFGFLSLGLYGLGYPDRAWAKSRQMLEVAQRSSA